MNDHQRIYLDELIKKFSKEHASGSHGPDQNPKHAKLGRRSMVALSILGCLFLYLLIAF